MQPVFGGSGLRGKFGVVEFVLDLRVSFLEDTLVWVGLKREPGNPRSCVHAAMDVATMQ